MRAVVLSVAGSDPSGGAGLQADLKTIHAHGAIGQAVPSLLTVQNSLGVREVIPLAAAALRRQLDALFEDTHPQAIKTGALADADAVYAIADALEYHRVAAPLVVDPVLVSSSGAALASPQVVGALRDRLLPRCTLVAPNLAEAAVLTGMAVDDLGDAHRAAERLRRMGCGAALVTGGHLPGDPVDVLVSEGETVELVGERIVTRHTHGTGCTYTAAIAARLGRGDPLAQAVAGAKRWLCRAIAGAPGLGRGSGMVDFFAPTDD